MIKIRNSCFETNSSSTHALILNNQQYNEDVSEGDLLTLVNLPELECNISILTGEENDVLYNGKHYSIYEGNFTNIVDKLRYLYTCMCQYGLYRKVEGLDKPYLDDSPDNNAYKIYKLLSKFLPKVKFIPPENLHCYVFEDCEYIIDELVDTKLFDTIRTLGLFLLKGQVVYCDRDTDSDLSEELFELARTNKYSICISG